MLYNKNSVRKTNDKKILHKVGKQWKVVSVALLMAIGGGAAVAATNANANADANNGVSQETQATVNSLEAGPQIGQSSAPASASSKASSASSAAPVMPQLSLNPDPSLNGNNASAEFARVKQGYDHAVVGYYGKLVNSYVNFVNSNYSASANSVNSNYASASNKQSNDSSSASSFAAVASGKDWMNEVNNIASAKSGVTGSEFIDAVQNTTSNNTASVSNSANVVSAASAVVSAAQLVSNVMANPNIKASYGLNATKAFYALQSAGTVYSYANSAYNEAIRNSADNQSAYTSAFAASEVLSLADSYAVNDNSSEDTRLTSSLASANKTTYSEASFEVNSYASASSATLLNDVFSAMHTTPSSSAHHNNRVPKVNLTSASNALTSAASSIAQLSGVAKTKAQQSLNNARNAYTRYSLNADKANVANALSKAVKTHAIHIQSMASTPASEAINNVTNSIANEFKFNSDEKNMLNSKATKLASDRGFSNNTLVSVSVGSKGAVSVNNFPVTASEISSAENDLSDAKSDTITDTSDAAIISKFMKANMPKPNKDGRHGAHKRVAPPKVTTHFTFGDDAVALHQLFLDTAVQQNYGALKSDYDNVMNNANIASASDASVVTSASATMTSTSAKKASAQSAYNAASVLANANNLSDVKTMEPSAGSFYSYDNNNVNNLLDTRNTNSSAISNAVSSIASEANKAGSQYTSASSASESYAKSTDANFVLASYYANSYSAMSNSDASAFNSASAARANFYNAYAGNDFASDNAQLTSAKADEPNQGALANGYARYVQIHEPHVVTVTKQLVMHANPNYNDKTDTPADAKLAVINKGTHLLVQNVGFDKHGNTRLYVNYNGKKGFVTGLRNYVADSYLVPGEKYSVTFGRTANQYKGLQFNKANATKFSVKAGQTVTGTAVLNDDPHYWNGLTRLQLSNGNFVTTLDSYIKSATPLNGQSTQQSKGAYFWNGQDNTFKNVTK